ncbi:hypothetical protein LX36DRAFT_363489 [Colletotrichum falcatum]|nr:hypothetical protein LX36DRAFT_363489 [Colletotrichum falcatum]
MPTRTCEALRLINKTILLPCLSTPASSSPTAGCMRRRAESKTCEPNGLRCCPETLSPFSRPCGMEQHLSRNAKRTKHALHGSCTFPSDGRRRVQQEKTCACRQTGGAYAVMCASRRSWPEGHRVCEPQSTSLDRHVHLR